MDWYISGDGQQEGPFSEEQVRLLAESGDLKEHFLMWRAGMKNWVPVTEVPGLLTPPPLNQVASKGVYPDTLTQPTKSTSLPNVRSEFKSSNQVRPWVRYWARMFDIYAFAIVSGFILATITPSVMRSKNNDLVFGIILVFVWVFFEALFISSFGTTPGKWLFKTKIQHPTGSKISYSEALNRGLKIWWRGLAAGIPIASLFTLATAHKRLTQNGKTSWDIEGDFSVEHERIGVARIIVVVAVVFLFLLFTSATR